MSGSIGNFLATGFQPTPNVGPDFGKMVANSQQLLQLRQQQQQVQQQNALLGVFQNPDAVDQKTGMPTADTLGKVTSINPQLGLQMRQNVLVSQDQQMKRDAMMGDEAAKNAERIADALSPVVENYQTNIKGGMTPEQANQKAAEEYKAAIDQLGASGFDPNRLKQAPQGWDPVKVPMLVERTKGFRDWQKEQLAAQRESDLAKRYGQMGQQTMQLASGETVVFHPGEQDPKKQYTYANTGEPVPAEKLGGLAKAPTGGGGSAAGADRKDDALIADYERNPTPEKKEAYDAAIARRDAEARRKGLNAGATVQAKTAAGGGSAATQDRAAIQNVVKTNYEAELGHPVDPNDPKQKAELDRRVLAAEDARGTQKVSDAATARQKAIADFENAGVPQSPEQAQATAAQIATGEPISQIIPGWGKQSATARTKARNDAIQLIMDQTGMDAVDAGTELANRGIEFAGGKKAQGVQMTMLATTRAAVKQLDFNIDKVKDELKKLGSTDVSPVINAIIRKEEQWTGDPALAQLFYSMNAVGMESARILSGGSASIQQLHEGAAKEAQRWANTDMTPAQFDAVAKTVSEEGKARLASWEASIKEGRIGGQPKTGNTAASAPAAPPVITDDDAGRAAHAKLQTGDKFIYGPGIYEQTPAGQPPKYLGPAPSAQQPAQTPPPQQAAPAPAQTQATPPIPAGLPPGSMWSASRKQWRDPAGKIYGADGKPVGD